MRLSLIIILCISASLCEVSHAAPTVYDLIIVAGQSNAVGFDAKPAELLADPIDSKVLFWWKTGDPPPDTHDSSSANAWTTLKTQPLGNPAPKESAPRQYGNFAQPEGGFGPEISFARHLLNANPNRKLAILKVAFSGTSISEDWDPNKHTESTSCYAALLTEFHQASAAAKETNMSLHPSALLWIQGESDATPTNAPRCADELGKLIAALRIDLDSPELHALLAVNTHFGKGNNPHIPTIVAAQAQVAEADARAVYIDTSKAPIANSAHYNTQGTLKVGKLFAEQWLKRSELQ